MLTSLKYRNVRWPGQDSAEGSRGHLTSYLVATLPALARIRIAPRRYRNYIYIIYQTPASLSFLRITC